LGIDLAKTIFQLHGADGQGNCVLRKRLARAKLAEYVVQLPPCLIGMEACGGAHYWARKFERMGHTVKLMSPQYVKPYVKSNKNDKNDAAGIAEAVTRPEMRFVPIKRIDQQDMLLVHRARELTVKRRTAQANQIRGLLAEYGVILGKGISKIRRDMVAVLDTTAGDMTELSRELFTDLYEQFKVFDEQVKRYDQKINRLAMADTRCRALLKIEGVGDLTATAMVGVMGDANVFKNGREVSAWLGLVPKQRSSGNKTVLLGISKRGDGYIRKLLIHGGRSVVRTCGDKTDRRSQWLQDKKLRRGENKAACALANKNARIIWSMLATGECYRSSQLEPGVAA
jgi:transposase